MTPFIVLKCNKERKREREREKKRERKKERERVRYFQKQPPDVFCEKRCL